MKPQTEPTSSLATDLGGILVGSVVAATFLRLMADAEDLSSLIAYLSGMVATFSITGILLVALTARKLHSWRAAIVKERDFLLAIPTVAFLLWLFLRIGN